MLRRSSLLSSPQVHRATSYIQTRLLIPYDLFAFGKSREKIRGFQESSEKELIAICDSLMGVKEQEMDEEQ